MAVREKSRARWYPRRDCGACGGLGFVPTHGGRHAAVKRCECWHRVVFGRKPAKAAFDGKLAATGETREDA